MPLTIEALWRRLYLKACDMHTYAGNTALRPAYHREPIPTPIWWMSRLGATVFFASVPVLVATNYDLLHLPTRLATQPALLSNVGLMLWLMPHISRRPTAPIEPEETDV